MQKTEQPKNSTRKKWKLALTWAKRLAIIFGIFVVLLAGIFGYLHTHQAEIKQVITKNINAQLNTKISVGDVSIDFFRKFPEVSVKFTNVRADEALPKSEQSLFLFKGIFVRFSIWDLLGQDYTIRKLSFDDGEVNLRVTPEGNINYHFWKDAQTNDDDSETSIALEDVEINNAKLRYIDEKLQLRVLLFLDHLQVKGNFSDHVFQSEIKGNGLLQDLTFEDLDFADDVQLVALGMLKVDGKSTKIDVQKLMLQDIVLQGNGIVRDNFQEWNVQSENTRLRQWLPIIPAQWRPNINPAILGGDARTQITVLLEGNTREVRAQSQLIDASLHLEQKKILLKNTNGAIHFLYTQNGNKNVSSLHFKNIKAKTKTGDLALTLAVENLFAPQIDATGQFNVQVAELLDIARPGLLRDGRGIAKGKFSYRQKFNNWQSMKEHAFSSPKLEGQIEVTEGAMTFENSNIVLEDISANLEMRNKDLLITRLFLREQNSEFLIEGVMNNALYFGPNRPVPQLQVKLQSSYVDLNRIMQWQLPRRANEDTTYTTDRNKPLAINYKVTLDVKKFDLIKFDGAQLTGEVWNEGLKMKGSNISFLGLNGQVNGSFSWATEPGGYRFWTQGTLQKIDIHQLFGGFENFGQNWLLADNIYGTGTASIETSMAFDKKLNFLPPSLKMVTDITIENGRLKGYKPLMSLSSLVEKQALEDVKFERLQNKIAISDQVITIPQMEIKSTALNLLLQGRHSFDQQIDYSIRLALKDVIGKKRKDKKTDLDDWIEEVETADQPYIWVHVGCSIADPCLTLDREFMKKGVKKEWQKQGEEIKNIFKPADKNAPPKKDPTKGEVIFEWNEEEPDTTGGGF